MLQYIVRRVFIMIPTLLVVSIVSFIVIQLPPGDYLTSYIVQLRASGDYIDDAEAAALAKRFGLGQPMYVQYLKWIWGIVHGDFGRSFEWNKPVGELIWGRLGLTVVLSLFTLVFQWIIAFAVGIYSATHQYSLQDYAFTFLGFIGLAIPDFMLALILMWGAYSVLGLSIGGLFSPDFIDESWSVGKVVDMLKHIWVPMIILGTGGTAGLIRTMRANLLDELQRPYVVTARAKGLKERSVLFKYPVRVALNPFFSTVGWSLPALISGATIVSVVLSLPTTGPMLLRALMSQDMFLAGSFLMMLSFLTIIGTFVSDILLAWLDPRIRYGESQGFNE
jgi:peptide/nickel transport system permease protein